MMWIEPRTLPSGTGPDQQTAHHCERTVDPVLSDFHDTRKAETSDLLSEVVQTNAKHAVACPVIPGAKEIRPGV